jgi:uncharacterized protein (DUF2235 family)
VALYAFDGTWNSDKPETEHDTNVVWIFNAYMGQKRYWSGVGTRFGLPGKLVGGITGAGGHDRIREALDELRKNFAAGDKVVDVVGFSRGAALAVDFANEVAKQTDLDSGAAPKVRFVGVFDIVGSFDLPGTDLNIGFDLKTPPTADHVVHAMALDERRIMFPLTRLTGSRLLEAGRLTEVWFRGVHSDVGGGDDATGLSSIALDFMFDLAVRAGIQLHEDAIPANKARMNPDQEISLHPQHWFEQLDPFRTLVNGDLIYPTVSTRVDKDGRHYNNPPASMARYSPPAAQGGAAGG